MNRPKINESYPPFDNPYAAELLSPDIREYPDNGNIVILSSGRAVCGQWLSMTAVPVTVNGVVYRTCEHLYQAARYPHDSRIQQGILSFASPFVAKNWSKKYRDEGRPDWYSIKVLVAWWILHLKLSFHYDTLGSVLDQTQDKLLLEMSPDGNFWGVVPNHLGMLSGVNAFGMLLMKIRQECRTRSRESLMVVAPPPVGDFLFFRTKVGTITVTR